MKLYHYIPKRNEALTKGIYSVSKLPEELLKYGKRLGTDDPKKILAWMEGTFRGRSRAISVLTEPVHWQGNDPMLKEWVDKMDLEKYLEEMRLNYIEKIEEREYQFFVSSSIHIRKVNFDRYIEELKSNGIKAIIEMAIKQLPKIV